LLPSGTRRSLRDSLHASTILFAARALRTPDVTVRMLALAAVLAGCHRIPAPLAK